MAHLSRRELLLLFGAAGVLPFHPLAAQEQPPQFAALDHFEFYVSDGEKARDFYTKIFGNTLLMRGAKRYLKLGSTYMAFEPPRGNFKPGQVDHVSAAIKSLDMNKLHAFLQERGVMYQDYPSGRDTGVVDPDGTRLQLSPENGWSLLNPATFLPEAVTLSGEPIFRARGLDHVMFNVTDLNRAVAHYQKLLGAPAQRDGSSAWFQAGTSRIGLSTTDRYICISVERYDATLAGRRLEQLGTKFDSPRFRDPDGLLIQVT
jgi:catechol 2,3-dioxygenase-like lactoylglutathione lyase family enzyme